MSKCEICGKEFSNFKGQKCPVCGKFICFKCAEKYCTSINLEDYQHQFVCNDCVTDKLEDLIDKAQYTQEVMYTAQSNHYKACEAITNEMQKLKEKNNESKTNTNDTKSN